MVNQSEISKHLKALTGTLHTAIGSITEYPFKITYSFDINCDDLPNHTIGAGVFNHSQFKELFNTLGGINKPIVYFFEVLSNHTNEELYKALGEYRNQKHKNFPALKKSFDSQTRVLYVGKMKKDTKGRMFVHLGYYDIIGTQGLQLCHWAVGIGLKLRLNIIELPFDRVTAGLVTHYEIELAKLLKPLAGKHR